MAHKQIFSLLLVGCLAALALANPLPEEHPAVPAPTGPATDPLYQNLAFKNAKLEGKKDKRSAEEVTTKTGGSLPTPVAPKVVPQTQEGKKEKLGSEQPKNDNVTKEFEELVSLLANPFSANLTGTAPSDKPKREAEEAKPKTEGVKVATPPFAAKPVTEAKKEKRESGSEAAELVKAQLICDREDETTASSQDDPSTVDEVYDIADGCQEQLRELKGETPRVESHSDEHASTEEKKEKRSVEEETPRLASKDVPNEKKEKRSAEEEKPTAAVKPVQTLQEKRNRRGTEEKPVVATKPAPKEEEHKDKRSAEEKPVVATKPAPKGEEHKDKRSAEEKPVVATKPAPKEEHKEKRSTEEKPVVATKPAQKEEEHKEEHKRSAEEKPVVATKPAPKEEEHKDKRSAEEKPVVATKPAPKAEEHKDKRSAEEKPVVATKPAPKEEEHKVKRSTEEKPVVATRPAPKEEEHKDKRSAEEKPVVATKPAPKEEHKEKRSAEEEKPTVGTKEVKVPQEKRERRGVNEEKQVGARDVPVPRTENKKDKRSTGESKGTEEATIKDEPQHSGPYPVPAPAQAGSKKEKRYVDQVRAEKQTVPALKSQEPGELEKKVERRSAETSSVIKGAAFEEKPWEVKPYVTTPPAKQAAKE